MRCEGIVLRCLRRFIGFEGVDGWKCTQRLAAVKGVLSTMIVLEQGTPHSHMWQLLDRQFRVNSGFFCSDIINIGAGTLLWFACAYRFTCNDSGNFALRIMHVACDDSLYWTDDDAGNMHDPKSEI